MRWFFLLLALNVGCTASPGNVNLEFSWPDAEPADFDRALYLAARLDGPSSISIPKQRFSDVIALDFGEHGNGGGYTVSVEIHDGPWTNSSILYRGRSTAFAIEPDRDSTVLVAVERVQQDSSIPASTALDTARLTHNIRAPSPGAALIESIEGQLEDVREGSRLLVFPTPDVNATEPIAILTPQPHVPFTLAFERADVTIDAPIYVAVEEPDLLLTDGSSAVGLQAHAVVDFDVDVAADSGWTQSRIDRALLGAATATRTLSRAALLHTALGKGSVIEAEGRPYWVQTSPVGAAPAAGPYATSATDRARGQTLVVIPQPSSRTPAVWLYDREGWHQQSAPQIELGTKTIALAFDAVNDEFLLVALQDTEERQGAWAFKDGTWRSESLPIGLAGFEIWRLAYHAELATMVLVGFRDDVVDTWTRDENRTWQIDERPGPVDLADLGLAYDIMRQVVVMVAALRDDTAQTWEWASDGWRRSPSVIHPEPRGDFSLVYDEASSRVVMMGGSTRTRTLADVVSWDGTQWFEEVPIAPYTRDGFSTHTAFNAPDGRGIIVFGGFDDARRAAGIMRWFRFAWRPEPDASALPAPTHAGGTMVFHTARGYAILDRGTGSESETWIRRGRVWERGPVGVTFDATGATAAYDSGRTTAYAFPTDAGTGSSTATLQWTDGGWVAMATNPGPSPKTGARAAYLPSEDAIFHFGGATSTASDELWRFEGGTWTAQAGNENTPSPRSGHGFAYNGDNALRLVGGTSNTGEPLNDTVKLGAIGWQTTMTLPFNGRSDFAFVRDAAHARSVLFGGRGDNVFYNETWLYAGAWRRVDVEGLRPAHRYAPAAIYDPLAAVTVIVGGRSRGGLVADEWEYHHPPSLRPAVVVGVPILATGVRTIVVDAEFGGRGDAEAGAALELYDHRQQRWRTVSSHNAGPNAPRAATVNVPEPHQDYLVGDILFARVRTIDGDSGGRVPPARVALNTIRVTVTGRRGDVPQICGDGIIVGSERCDDGNAEDGDGCNATCRVERHTICVDEPSICAVCGDDRIDPGETCDDGELTMGRTAPINGDGCNDRCQTER